MRANSLSWARTCHINMYLKYMILREIPCNLLLWGCKSWALRQFLLNTLDIFLHCSIMRILGINMTKVRDMRIKNTFIRIMFYNIPCIRNQVAFWKLYYIGKIFRREESHIPTCLLTAWSNHPMKHGQPLLTNKMSLYRNLWLVIPDVDETGSLLGWGFHALDTGHWRNLLATLKYLKNTTPDVPSNIPYVNTDVPPYSNTELSPSPPRPPSRPPPPRSPPPRTSRDRRTPYVPDRHSRPPPPPPPPTPPTWPHLRSPPPTTHRIINRKYDENGVGINVRDIEELLDIDNE